MNSSNKNNNGMGGISNSPGNSSSAETRWYYHGPDNENYGPYTSKDMTLWTQSGYFPDSLPIRTENEDRFHSLGEYTRMCGGKSPFSIPVYSMEALVQQFNNMARPPMMIVPPGLAPPYAPPPVRYPPFMHHAAAGMPPILSHPQQLAGGPLGPNANLHSQPPSEPIDAGSLSHTPDSENEIGRSLLRSNSLFGLLSANQQVPVQPVAPHPQHLQQQIQQRNAYVMAEGPKMNSVHTETERVYTREVSCQTNPIIIPSKDAARLLSELIGQTVHVT